MHPSYPQNLFQQLDEAVSEVFSLMLQRACTPALACPTAIPGLSALVRFSGTLNGMCIVHLDLSSADELAEQLTGEPSLPGSGLAEDTVGELCNMIAGSWKSRLAAPLAGCKLSSPTLHPGVCLPAEENATMVTRSYHFAPYCFTLNLSLS